MKRRKGSFSTSIRAREVTKNPKYLTGGTRRPSSKVTPRGERHSILTVKILSKPSKKTQRSVTAEGRGGKKKKTELGKHIFFNMLRLAAFLQLFRFLASRQSRIYAARQKSVYICSKCTKMRLTDTQNSHRRQS